MNDLRIDRLNPAYLAPLDGLRGLAAVMVIVFHAWQSGYLGGGPAGRLAVIGQTGVDLFFVISGFLITRILLATRAEPGHLTRFYLRRVLRIFPLYYLGLLVYCQALPRLTGGAGVPLAQDWWFLVYLQNVPQTIPGLSWAGPDHYWSLAVEEHFYLVWPWIVALIPNRRLPVVSVIVIGATVACRWWFIHQLGLGTFFATPCRLDGLAVGALLASAERGDLSHLGVRWLAQWSPVACGVIGAGLLALWPEMALSGSTALGILKYTAIALFYGSVIAWIVFRRGTGRLDSAIHRLLSTRLARGVGRISYGLYVYHPAWLILVQIWLPSGTAPLVRLSAALAGTVALSWISFRWFEQAFLRLRPSR